MFASSPTSYALLGVLAGDGDVADAVVPDADEVVAVAQRLDGIAVAAQVVASGQHLLGRAGDPFGKEGQPQDIDRRRGGVEGPVRDSPHRPYDT